ncbi:MAG: hypothetical protein V4473_01715 [Patescibacteria group bacterium]
MKKIIMLGITLLVLGVATYVYNPLSIKGNSTDSIPQSGQSGIAPFSWPERFRVDVKRVSVDDRTGTQTVNVNYHYLADGQKIKDVPIDQPVDSTIFRLDTHVMYSINNATKVYKTTSLRPDMSRSLPFYTVDTTWTFEKKDTESGVSCDRYHISRPLTGNKPANPEYICIDPIRNIPVYRSIGYIEEKNGTYIVHPVGFIDTYSNYSSDPIPASEFEVPPGYINFDEIPTH